METLNERFSLRVDGDRLWRSLMDMAQVGATMMGGCNRQALSDEDRAGHDLFCAWSVEAGCKIRVDDMGNIFARLEGQDPSRTAILIGSHLDTQAT